MNEIAMFTKIGFVLVVLLTVGFFSFIVKKKKAVFLVVLWMVITGILGFVGFYKTPGIPPRFIFLIGPGIVFVLILAFFNKQKSFYKTLDIRWLTLIHSVRIPVEIILYAIFLDGVVPKSMTFEGYNFDLLSGISAPVIYYLAFIKKTIGKLGLIAWNILCLTLLFNILVIAIFSARTPFQLWAFDQPNVGVTYFPFVWLPSVVVPIVLFCHVASIKKLVGFDKN